MDATVAQAHQKHTQFGLQRNALMVAQTGWQEQTTVWQDAQMFVPKKSQLTKHSVVRYMTATSALLGQPKKYSVLVANI